MLALKTYQQTGIFDPYNPTQRKREVYTGIPGGYGSFYWNVQPNTAQLGGLRGLGFTFSALPQWQQLGLVGGIAAVAGYFAMSRYGKQIKSFVGLSGARRRRR
jgi:hypothetical protein